MMQGTRARHSRRPEPARRAETYYQAAGMPSGMSVFVYKEVGQHQRTEYSPVLCVRERRDVYVEIYQGSTVAGERL